MAAQFSPEEVDIRLAVTPYPPDNRQAVKLVCPNRGAHRDGEASLAVYPGNIHCFGCGFHIKRRYEALAFLLGVSWQEARALAGNYLSRNALPPPPKPPVPLPDNLPVGYQMLLWTTHRDRLEYLLDWRGLSKQTVKDARIGYDGSRYTIPVYSREGRLLTIRYRADAPDLPKYCGMPGRNETYLYPAWFLKKDYYEEIVVVEGELDTLPLWADGIPAVSVTNGAGQVLRVCDLLSACGVSTPRILIATDLDAAGVAAAEQVMERCGELGVDTERLLWDNQYKDVTELYKNGGSIRGRVYEKLGEGEGAS